MLIHCDRIVQDACQCNFVSWSYGSMCWLPSLQSKLHEYAWLIIRLLCLQVYVHHYVSSSAFLLGNGAELRGSFSRQPVKEPYALVIDTQKLKNDTIR